METEFTYIYTLSLDKQYKGKNQSSIRKQEIKNKVCRTISDYLSKRATELGKDFTDHAHQIASEIDVSESIVAEILYEHHGSNSITVELSRCRKTPKIPSQIESTDPESPDKTDAS